MLWYMRIWGQREFMSLLKPSPLARLHLRIADSRAVRYLHFSLEAQNFAVWYDSEVLSAIPRTRGESQAKAYSPEAELLLCCARTSKDSETASRMTALLREDIDWLRVLELARKHRMMPLLYWHLGVGAFEAIPTHFSEELRSSFHQNSLRNLQLTGELLRITRTFEAHTIPIVPYKGPVLAAMAYENLALREFNDLDILVHKQDVARARDLLISMGYRQQNRLAKAQEAAFLKTQREYVFARKDGTVVELHWAVMPRILSFELEPEDLWDRVSSITLGGDTVSTFSPDDTLLFLCAHGSKHFWYRLAWICDVAELIRVTETIDWERLTEHAGRLGAQRMLFLGLLLANDLIGSPLPQGVTEKIQSDRVVKSLATQVQGWLFQESGKSSDIFAKDLAEESSFHPFRVRIRERFRDKVLYSTRTALTPTPEDWEFLTLPQPLFPLYYVLRPLRIGARYGQRLLKR
jgi:hypothetical protein